MNTAVNAEGRWSRTSTRVRYPETDRMGVAYHGHYLVWFELGRTELMRELGATYGDLEDQAGILFPVVRVAVRYRVPARYDDRLEIRSKLAEIGGSRVRFAYRLVREVDGVILATGSTEHATVGRDGRPRRLPEELKGKLMDWESDQ